MNRKKRIISLLIGIVLCILGFGCIAVAAIVQDILGNHTAGIFCILGFALLIIAVIYMQMTYPKLIASEMEEKAADMQAESRFFQKIQFQEDVDSLAKKLVEAGFTERDDYFFKSRFSALQNIVHYYFFILDNVDVREYIDSFLDRMDDLLARRSILRTDKYVCLMFFQDEISEEDLAALKDLIISQDIMQEIPRKSWDTVVPIVYDTGSREYIVRTNNKKQWYKPIYRATKAFCRYSINTYGMETK